MAEICRDDLAVIRELEGQIGRVIPVIEKRELQLDDVGCRVDDEGRVVGLSLYGCGLRDATPICRLTNLTELYLGGNRLTSLPEGLGGLTNLTELYLHNNQLRSFPEGLGGLTKLTKLHLDFNQLRSLPEWLGRLTKLTELSLGGNQLALLPEWLGRLTNLTRLSLDNNQLRSLPEWLGRGTNLTVLSLHSNQLTSLPECLGGLTKLTKLYLHSNQLMSLPEGLRGLTNLTELYLNDNQLSSLPEWLGEMTKLTELHLRNNKLMSLPDCLRTLTNLTILNLSRNQLTSLTDGIGVLEKLIELDLGYNQFTSVPDWIGGLTNLSRLDLGSNQLISLPEKIRGLKNLIIFDLSCNRFALLPEWLGKLTKLIELDLYGNLLTSLPEWILDLSLPILWNEMRYFEQGINLYGNPLEVPPEKVVKQGNEAIRNYFEAMRRAKETLNEAKVLLVGDGKAGKTSVIRRVFGEPFDENESQTKGIVIRKKLFQINRQRIKAHFWDFGGQVIMHATHQFFLSERSLYILLLDGRKEEDPEYWLQLIESFGGGSPILVVMNRMDENPSFDVNRRFLQDKYKGIVGFYRISCKDGQGFNGKNGLVAGIRAAIAQVEMLQSQWPKSWLRVKEQLEAMKSRQEHFISARDYQRTCERADVLDEGEQGTLVSYLHDLGLILHFPELNLSDMHILEPHWVTDAVYRVINSNLLAERHGDLYERDLPRILKKRNKDDYSYVGKYGYILELMQKFELCFSFPDGNGHFLIPELLDKQQPAEAEDFKAEECLNFSYCYPILPEGLLPRFIVRTHVLSRDLPRWRTGVILRLEEHTALVVGDVKAKQVSVRVKGPLPGRQRLLAVIRSDFEHIHSQFTFEPEEFVSVPRFPDEQVKYKDLLVLEQSGETHFKQVVKGKVEKLNVQELLNGVDLQGVRRPCDEHFGPLRLFYSYCHRDETLRNELETHLKILERTGVIAGWHDRKITAGEEWKGKIDERLRKADLILLLVSADFIASDYCWDIEMRLSFERHEMNEARVIPVILRDTNWGRAPFARIQALPKDGKAVVIWTNRDTAWRNVSEGIEKAAIEILEARRERAGESNIRKGGRGGIHGTDGTDGTDGAYGTYTKSLE